MVNHRPKGTKNAMRTPEEKEKIVLEYMNGKVGRNVVAEKYGISKSLMYYWIRKYQEKGFDGLKSSQGKNTPNLGKYKRNPTEDDKLKKEIVKLEIEVARLKKGYQVKGVGAKKEYVTTFEENTK